MSNDKEKAKHALLKELDDVQSLLDDAERPIPPSLLRPATDIAARDSQRIRQLASERANPFLARSAGQGDPVAPAPATSPQATEKKRPTLSRQDLDTAVDELMAEALPKLEKALRLKLRAALRRKS